MRGRWRILDDHTEHGKNVSESIEPTRSEINPTDALPPIPRVGLALDAPFETCPDSREDDGLLGKRSNFGAGGGAEEPTLVSFGETAAVGEVVMPG
jgi:hypothetical protein